MYEHRNRACAQVGEEGKVVPALVGRQGYVGVDEWGCGCGDVRGEGGGQVEDTVGQVVVRELGLEEAGSGICDAYVAVAGVGEVFCVLLGVGRGVAEFREVIDSKSKLCLSGKYGREDSVVPAIPLMFLIAVDSVEDGLGTAVVDNVTVSGTFEDFHGADEQGADINHAAHDVARVEETWWVDIVLCVTDGVVPSIPLSCCWRLRRRLTRRAMHTHGITRSPCPEDNLLSNLQAFNCSFPCFECKTLIGCLVHGVVPRDKHFWR